MIAAASSARSTFAPLEYALVIGGLPDVPDDEPGVEDGVAGGVIAG
jgi:hypothetical protein